MLECSGQGERAEEAGRGYCEVREPQAVYDCGYSTAAPRGGVAAEPWLRIYEPEPAEDEDDEDMFSDDDDCYDENGWHKSMWDHPELIARLERIHDEFERDLAAGTLVTYTTDEVFDRLHKKFPELFGVVNG